MSCRQVGDLLRHDALAVLRLGCVDQMLQSLYVGAPIPLSFCLLLAPCILQTEQMYDAGIRQDNPAV